MDSSLSLNVHLTVPSTNSQEAHTPNTPEILNSIVNMTNGPFDGLDSSFSSTMTTTTTTSASTPSTPSIQQYRSQFIKEGLKMKVKRKLGESKDEQPLAKVPKKSAPTRKAPVSHPKPRTEIKNEFLSPEDAAKRNRRRERNKIAATKCRNKKKVQYSTLNQEYEDTKKQNSSLKTESNRLELEKQKLKEVLDRHKMATSLSCPLYNLLVKEEKDYQEGFSSSKDTTNDTKQFQRTCSFSNNQSSNFFLAKACVPPGYYDLNGRCMAM